MTTTTPAPPASAPPVRTRRRQPIDWRAVRTLLARDIGAVTRAKAVVWPMVAVPALMLVILPAALAFSASHRNTIDLKTFLDYLPDQLANPVRRQTPDRQLLVLINGYLLAPLFLIVPLMVSAVLSADTFAGEKERKTLESLLHLPISDRDLFLAKFLGAFLPSVLLSWFGFFLYVIVTDAAAWPLYHHPYLPNVPWALLIFWIAPSVAAVGQGIMVRISARAKGTQEANQLGGTVILPLVILAVGQTTSLLVAPPLFTFLLGAALWVVGIFLNVRGARRFTRERLAPRL